MKEFADDNFQIDEMAESCPPLPPPKKKRFENTVGKVEIVLYKKPVFQRPRG